MKWDDIEIRSWELEIEEVLVAVSFPFVIFGLFMTGLSYYEQQYFIIAWYAASVAWLVASKQVNKARAKEWRRRYKEAKYMLPDYYPEVKTNELE